jgi:hypothetical protein
MQSVPDIWNAFTTELHEANGAEGAKANLEQEIEDFFLDWASDQRDPIPVSRGYVKTLLQRDKRKWLCKRRRELKKRRLHKIKGTGAQTVLTQFMNLEPRSQTAREKTNSARYRMNAQGKVFRNKQKKIQLVLRDCGMEPEPVANRSPQHVQPRDLKHQETEILQAEEGTWLQNFARRVREGIQDLDRESESVYDDLTAGSQQKHDFGTRYEGPFLQSLEDSREAELRSLQNMSLYRDIQGPSVPQTGDNYEDLVGKSGSQQEAQVVTELGRTLNRNASRPARQQAQGDRSTTDQPGERAVASGRSTVAHRALRGSERGWSTPAQSGKTRQQESSHLFGIWYLTICSANSSK